MTRDGEPVKKAARAPSPIRRGNMGLSANNSGMGGLCVGAVGLAGRSLPPIRNCVINLTGSRISMRFPISWEFSGFWGGGSVFCMNLWGDFGIHVGFVVFCGIFWDFAGI